MKKKIISLISVLLLLFSLAACGEGNSGEDKQSINVYNWGEYIDQSVLDDFEAETGIKVNYTTFESNETMYSQLKSGGVSYDVIIPSDYMIERLKNEGMLRKIDTSSLSNFHYISDEYKETLKTNAIQSVEKYIESHK